MHAEQGVEIQNREAKFADLSSSILVCISCDLDIGSTKGKYVSVSFFAMAGDLGLDRNDENRRRDNNNNNNEIESERLIQFFFFFDFELNGQVM